MKLDRRLAFTLFLAGALVAFAWWASSAHQQARTGGEAGIYPMQIEGPDGWRWNGTVAVGAPATVLALLEAAAAQGDFAIDVEQQVLGAYVRAIGNHGQTATGGWNFCVDEGEGPRWVPSAADTVGLQRGQSVLWVWVEGGSERCVGE